MNREEIYRAMELEKIIMYDEFRAKLDKLELNELEARWTGVLELDVLSKHFFSRVMSSPENTSARIIRNGLVAWKIRLY